jgi:isoquinoline 1-oxidoreductase beta subunit
MRSTLTAGAWTIGLSGAGIQDLGAQATGATSPFRHWLRLLPDGTIVAHTTVTNLGQGTHAAIAQLVAEELSVGAARVRVEHAPVKEAFHQKFPPGITTFASAGFLTAWKSLGPACAAARDMLRQAAANHWNVTLDSCEAVMGQVLHLPSGRRLAYTQLQEAAALVQPIPVSAVRPATQWRVLGKSRPRPDIPARVDGSARYGIDVRVPGMMFAAVLHAPSFGGKLIDVDPGPAMALAGVRHVVKLPGAVAVVANRYWIAQKALALLRPEWQDGPFATASTASISAAMHAAVLAGAGMEFPVVTRDLPKQNAPATAEALQKAATVIDTTFELPFLAHAAMEPLNATVSVSGAGAEIWLSTQSQTDTQRAVAKALEIPVEAVIVHSEHVGGGFGRRLEHDFAVEAALVARASGGPVKMIWSRENDMRAGYYRQAAVTRVRLALDSHFIPTGIRGDMAGPSLLEYSGVTNGKPIKGFDWSYLMGWTFSDIYDFPLYDTRWSRVDFGIPCGYWRSVGNSQNCFFVEHTIDLAARAAQADPVDYRKRMLSKNARALAFVDALAGRAGWKTKIPAQHFRGFAVNLTNDTFSGHVVEVQVTGPGKFRLVRITAAIDPGLVADPRSVEAQLMGGTLFGLSAALFSEINIKDGRAIEGNFDGYRVARLAETPPLDVLVISSGQTPYGVGEEGPPSIGPALANALLAANGVAVNRLPVSRAGWVLDE